MNQARPVNWPWPVRALHWLTLILVIAAWRLAEAGEHADGLMQWHHTLGIVLAGVILARLVLRMVMTAPEPAPGRAGKLAGLAHLGLLGLLLMQAGSGLLSVWFEGEPVMLFGQAVAGPGLPMSEDAGEAFEELHEDVFWSAFVALLVIHVGAALFHHLVLRDQILRRMLGRARSGQAD